MNKLEVCVICKSLYFCFIHVLSPSFFTIGIASHKQNSELGKLLIRVLLLFRARNMDASEDQNANSTDGNPQTTGNSRPPQIAHMSLCERQAVQALQALQRQPNAAHYFQQLMLHQQFNSVPLNTLAAVQQVTENTATSTQSRKTNL